MSKYGPKPTPIEERFWRHVDTPPTGEGCWEWTGTKNNAGYGSIGLGRPHRMALAHRVSHELFKGPIPDGLVIDHLCRNSSCVNPAHIEAVIQAVNLQRGIHTSKTACRKGHEYTPENTLLLKSDNGRRRCRTCNPWRHT